MGLTALVFPASISIGSGEILSAAAADHDAHGVSADEPRNRRFWRGRSIFQEDKS
jgi:hypothetical protein